MRRLLLSACVLRFLDAFVIIAPFYTVMFAERGLTPVEISIALAAWSVVGLVLEVPCGVLADRMSRPLLISIAQLLRCVGYLFWIGFPNFWGFVIGLMLWGMKSATLSGAFEALIYDELKRLGREAEYAKVFGRSQSARFAGFLAAALVAAGIAETSYDTLIWASFATSAAAAGAAFLLPHAPRAMTTARHGYFAHLVRGAREAASLPGVPPLLIFMAGTGAIVLAVADYWQIFGREVGLSRREIALWMAAMSAAGVVAAALAHRLRRLPLRALHLMFALGGACLIAAAALYQVWSILLPVVFVALYWVVDTNADARFQHALKPETRATVASCKGFAMQCMTALLMLAFGAIAQVADYQAAFLAAGLAAVILGLVYAARREPSPA